MYRTRILRQKILLKILWIRIQQCCWTYIPRATYKSGVLAEQAYHLTTRGAYKPLIEPLMVALPAAAIERDKIRRGITEYAYLDCTR